MQKNSRRALDGRLTSLLDERSMVARPLSARPLARWPQWCTKFQHEHENDMQFNNSGSKLDFGK